MEGLVGIDAVMTYARLKFDIWRVTKKGERSARPPPFIFVYSSHGSLLLPACSFNVNEIRMSSEAQIARLRIEPLRYSFKYF